MVRDGLGRQMAFEADQLSVLFQANEPKKVELEGAKEKPARFEIRDVTGEVRR